DIERLKQIREQVDIALVLHGSSGTPEAQLQKAIGAGIDKINVYTDIRLKVMQEIHTLLTLKAADKLDIIDLDSMTRIFTQEVVRQKNLLFGSVGKANAI
ncbi:MAG TPA: tagatose-bisphosphate aldolase, partial [Firmicutes bacterium]|nr:tagatose-bisphosphate aldolase [Bacillota bacterium]